MEMALGPLLWGCARSSELTEGPGLWLSCLQLQRLVCPWHQPCNEHLQTLRLTS